MSVEIVGQITPAGATEGAPSVLVVALIARRDVNGTERIAIDNKNAAVSSFPSKSVDQTKLHDWAAIWQMFALPSTAIVSQRVVHIEHETRQTPGTSRLYWYVNVTSGYQPPDLGAAVDWVKIEKLSKRLTDHRDLFALAAVTASRELHSTLTLQIRHRFLFNSANRARLLGELRRMEIELSLYQAQYSLDRNYRASLLSLSKGFLAVKQRDYEGGWKCLSDTERQMFFIMNEEQLAAKRILLEESAEVKLNGWREEAFDRLIKKNFGPKFRHQARHGTFSDS